MSDPTAALAFYLALSGLVPAGPRDTVPVLRGNLMVHALRSSGEISLDGVLSEAAWASAEPVTSFTQREPHEGAPATEQTEV